MTVDNLTNHDAAALPVIAAIEEMTASQCLNVIIHGTRMKAFYEAQIVKALARFADLRPPGEVGDELDGDGRKLISAELAVSPRVVDTQIRQSQKLVESLPATLSALGNGEIDQRRALAMVELVGNLSKEDASKVEVAVLEGGARTNYQRFRDSVRQQVIKVDADAVARRKASRQNPDVSVEPCVDGMSKLTVDMATNEAIIARKRIDALAEQAKIPGDTRTEGQRRVAVVFDLVVGNNGGDKPTTKIAVDGQALPTARTERSEQLSEPTTQGSTSTTEQLVDAASSPGSADPTGHVLDMSHHRYVRPAQLQRADECQTAGCREAVETSRVPGADSPQAAAAGTRCVHHRITTQHNGWTFNHPAPGVLTLTSPDGHTTHAYVIAPDQYLDPPA